MEKEPKYIIGIDEVGRGPLAGPVAVCAFLIKNEKFLQSATSPTCGRISQTNISATGLTGGYKEIGPSYVKLPKLKDSKKLSKKQREEWFEYLKIAKTEGFCDYSVSFVSPENIDKFGIAKCIKKALNQSLEKVTSQDYENSLRFTPEGPYATKNFHNPASFDIFLDGGLHAPSEYTNQETIIKGDELHPVISMASIMAKVSRDKIMTNYAKTYPEYGFENHSGYGTKAHYEAIKKHGQTPIHRKTFIH